ncbi:hypothetical protein C2857_002799 [Epichloe festucae Fl1]|uniref:Wbp11/ELF5/Saf1 N-terminal domain-containing protein n=1 Tax=Epichloe festucae (strain Fl1) TaxID=877507 RepID=A0A7U3Q1U4_EPIFF|nr:hypothetical protein C2857_002799 [Epichloe festucae Fl1]
MPKERNYNPVQAQRKADKAKAIKKGKAEIQERRNERLARQNPERIQKQIDDLKAIADGGGKLSRNEEQLLEGLEKEIKAIKKARETLGDKAPSFGRGPRRDGDAGVLGKRRRGSSGSSTDDDVPEDVRRIPMPRDTPPPIPKEVLDQWYAKRRARRNQENEQKREFLGKTDDAAETEKEALPSEPQTIYEAKPILRNLRQEAVSAFVPAAVQRKLNKGRGQGGLLEPEEADRLEREGYLKTSNAEGTSAHDQEKMLLATAEDAEDAEDDDE